jgi:hypothetical protein
MNGNEVVGVVIENADGRVTVMGKVITTARATANRRQGRL